MKRILFIMLLLIVFLTKNIVAQNVPALLSASDRAAFCKLLAQVASVTESISADFYQHKSIPMLKNKMLSKGLFLFKREEKIAFLYKDPVYYQMIINGDKLRLVSDGSDRTMDLKNNPVMGEVRELISASFLGKLSDRDNSYTIEYLSSPKGVIVTIIPLNKQLLSIIKKITITFNSTSANIESLHIEEGSGGYTEYIFKNQKRNILLNDEVFLVN